MSGVWDTLQSQCQDMALVSTVAIGLDKPGSDLDLVCQHPDPAAFAASLRVQGWQGRERSKEVRVLKQTRRGPDDQEWPLELYVTPSPIETLHGWRHLSLMATLLEHFGHDFYLAVMRLRHDANLKGEAAICQLLHLPGDPYLALLALEGVDLAPLVWQSSSLTHHSRFENTLLMPRIS